MAGRPASRPSGNLGALVRQMQSRFLRSAEPHQIFDPLLPELLGLSESEYGFIGEVWREADGTPYLKIFTLTNIAWSANARDRIERDRMSGIEFRNLDTLFGAAIRTGQPVVANDAARDQRRGAGVPAGHAPLRSFLGVPLHFGGELVGEIGLANRPQGYDAALLRDLEPLCAAVAGIIGAVQLDRERRVALEALTESERRHRTTFDMAAVGIARVSREGRVLDANESCCELLGRARGHLVDRPWQDCLHPDDAAADRAARQSLEQGVVSRERLEARCVRPDGRVVWTECAYAPVPGPDGRLDHVVCVVHDVSERRDAREARVAAEAASRSNAAKTEFLSRMSHELRTPLNAVQGFAQLLQIDPVHPLVEPQRQKVRQIERAGRHLLAMINDVLDLSRIEAGHLQVQPESIELGRLVGEVSGLMDGAAREASVHLEIEPSSRPELRVMADRVRLRQVLVNLVSNAIKYNRPGGDVRIAWRETRDGSHAEIDVSDTGRGMTREQIEHLFEPFNRLGAERSNVDGTGIGLVITHRLLDLMRGGLQVESRPQVGSRFRVLMPLPPADSDFRSFDTKPAALDDAPQTRRTVLYAEDNPSNVELVRQVFGLRPAWDLVVARSGGQALHLLEHQSVDLLLLDMHLGDMTGVELLRALAERPELGALPRVALSADAMPERIEAARRAGVADYLTKPLDVTELLRCLDSRLAV